MAFLREKNTTGVEKKFELSPHAKVIIGRSPERATILVPGGAVSGTHASIHREGGNWILRDLNSTNGTRVNGTGCPPETNVLIYRGDIIQFADYPTILEGSDVQPRPSETGSVSGMPAGIKPISTTPPSAGKPILSVPPKDLETPPTAILPPSEKTPGEIAQLVGGNNALSHIVPRSAGSGNPSRKSAVFRKKTSSNRIWFLVIGIAALIAICLLAQFFTAG